MADRYANCPPPSPQHAFLRILHSLASQNDDTSSVCWARRESVTKSHLTFTLLSLSHSTRLRFALFPPYPSAHDLHAQWPVPNAPPLWRINFAPLPLSPSYPLQCCCCDCVFSFFYTLMRICKLKNLGLPLSLLSANKELRARARETNRETEREREIERALCIQRSPFSFLRCCLILINAFVSHCLRNLSIFDLLQWDQTKGKSVSNVCRAALFAFCISVTTHTYARTSGNPTNTQTHLHACM